jgi:hypothetical protein
MTRKPMFAFNGKKINAFLAILNLSNGVWDNHFLSGGIFDKIL